MAVTEHFLPAKFEAFLVSSIPPMAWLYRMEKGKRPVLLHGSSVEILPDGFFEGCFPGRWQQDDFTLCADVFGSGLKIKGGTHCFVSPSHMTETLFLLSQSGSISVSNSMCFLLEYHHASLPVDLDYGFRFATICRGIRRYSRKLAVTDKGILSRAAGHNLSISEDFSIHFAEKTAAPRFSDFNSYQGHLLETLRLCFANASDPDRKMRFVPLATCSAGYDSSACAALARDLGCSTAITTKTARDGHVDTGRPVADALGMRIIEVEREPRIQSFEDAAEFLATGMGGQDYNFRNFASHLHGRLLLTGIYGDRVWDVHAEPDGVIGRHELTANSLQEFRLNTNFIHLPLPAISIRNDWDIAAISLRDEMKPFTLNNHYDRPIARRFLEQRGVPRAAFGQIKSATAFLLFQDPSMLPPPDPTIAEAIRQGARSRAKVRCLAWAWRTRLLLHRKAARLSLFFGPFKYLARLIVAFDFCTFEHHHPQAAVDFLFGVAWTR